MFETNELTRLELQKTRGNWGRWQHMASQNHQSREEMTGSKALVEVIMNWVNYTQTLRRFLKKTLAFPDSIFFFTVGLEAFGKSTFSLQTILKPQT